MKWRTLALIAVGLLVVVCAANFLLGWQRAEFTAQEKAMLDKLAPVLDTLVLAEQDLSSLSGHYELCEADIAYSLRYEYEPDSGDVEDVRRVESDDNTLDDFDYSLFCDWESAAFVSSVVALPDSKDTLMHYRGVARDLAHGEGKGMLQKLAEANSDDLHPQEVLLDYAWLKAPPLGDARYAWVRTVEDLETGEQFELYDFFFTRGVAMAGLLVKLPASPTAQSEASYLAVVLDNKIAAKMQLLRPQVQAE